MLEKETQFLKQEGAKPEQKEDKKEGLAELRDRIRKRSLELRKEGVPVDERARINVDEFHGIYSVQSIESDKAWIKELKGRWKEAAIAGSNLSWAFPKEEALREMPTGDIFEMLTTSILDKNLGEDFIVTRTSEYDDARNKVDHMIAHKPTKTIVCAFDEIGAVSGERFKEKQNKILERNWKRGGADLKYGIFFEGKEGKMKLKKGHVFQVPLFYLAMSKEDIKKTLDDPSQQEKVFHDFIGSV